MQILHNGSHGAKANPVLTLLRCTVPHQIFTMAAMGHGALIRWKHWLLQSAENGSLVSAAVSALQLPGPTGPLLSWVEALRRGDAKALPAVTVLPEGAMNGALGAYGASRETIFLDGDWLATATDLAIMRVLTEELGHHLDHLLNDHDTPGDEGALFAWRLMGTDGEDSAAHGVLSEDDHGFVLVEGESVAVEQAIDTTKPRITGLELGNTVLNPSLPGGAYLSVRLSFADDSSGFDYANITFDSVVDPSKKINFYVSRYDLDRGNYQAGSVSKGELLGANQYINGAWKLGSIDIRDIAGNLTRKGSSDSDWSNFLIASGIAQASFTINGSIPDIKPPQIKRLQFANTVIDRTLPAQELHGVLEVSDDLSGFSTVELSYTGNPGSAFISISLDDSMSSGSSLVSGSLLDGLVSFKESLRYAEPGSLNLDSIRVSDKAGNVFRISKTESGWTTYLSQIGLSSSLTVIGSNPVFNPGPGTLDPKLTGYSLPRNRFTPSQLGGDVFSAEVRWIDDNRPPYGATLVFKNSSHPSSLFYAQFYDNGPAVPQKNTDGMYIGSISSSSVLNQYMPKGLWELDSVYDDFGVDHSSTDSDWSQYLQSSGLAGFSFQIDGAPGSPEDVSTPSIVGIEFKNTVFTSQSGNLFGDNPVVSFRDDLSGIDQVGLEFLSDQGYIFFYGDGGRFTSNFIAGSGINGSIVLRGNNYLQGKSGTYRLDSVSISDKAGNDFYIDSSDADWLGYLARSGIRQTTISLADAPAVSLPVVSVAVSPSSVTEDGTSNLVYTFTRSGDTANSLTINYQVGGTASIGTDYSGIDVTLPVKAVTFAPGSATATVIVDPTPDSISEADETVVLTILDQTSGAAIVGGVGPIYSVGFPSSATGVIVNVPPPAALKTTVKVVNGVTLLLDSSSKRYLASVPGAVPVEISWGLGAPGLPVTDTTFLEFKLLAASRVNGVNMLLWRHQPTNQVLTWTMDANWHKVGGSGLIPANGLEAQNLEGQFQVDLDANQILGSTESVIRFKSGSSLLRSSTMQLKVQDAPNGATYNLTWLGKPLLDQDPRLLGWQALAAARINGVNQLLWKHSSSGDIVTWSMDSRWSFVSGSSPVSADSAQASTLETLFGIDLNRDETVGTVNRLVQFGPSSLLRRQSTTKGLMVDTAGGSQFIQWGGRPILDPDPRLVGWTALAATTVGGNRLLWRQDNTGDLAEWSFDDKWQVPVGASPVSSTSSAAYGYEVAYGVDLNGDRTIGSPLITVAVSGSARLIRRSTDNALLVSTGGTSPVNLSWLGIPLAADDSRLPGWRAIAATMVPGVNALLWRNETQGQLAVWTFDDRWSVPVGAAPVAIGSAAADALERAFALDTNRDGRVGEVSVPYRVPNLLALLPGAGAGWDASADGGLTRVRLSWDGKDLKIDDSRLPDWTPISISRVNGVNALLWGRRDGTASSIWTFDNQWKAIGFGDIASSTSSEALDSESNFQIDLNGDRSIGSPVTVISTVGGLSLARRSADNAMVIVNADGSSSTLRWAGTLLQADDPRLPGWKAVASARINDVNTLLWRHSVSGDMTTWSFDDRWRYTKGAGIVKAGSTEAFSLESQYGYDVNGDGLIGLPYQRVSTSGLNQDFLVRLSGNRQLAYAKTNDVVTPLRWNNQALLDGDSRLPRWEALAIISSLVTANGSELLWREKGTGNLVTWQFDQSGVALSGTQPILPFTEKAYQLEQAYAFDLNADRVIGSPKSTVSERDVVKLERHVSTGRLSVKEGDRESISLNWQGQPLYYDDPRLAGWKPIAAAQVYGDASVTGVNTLLWQNSISRAVVTWTYDSNWVFVNGKPPIDANSAEALKLEASFNIDLNGDRTVGEPLSAVELFRSLVINRSPSANARSPFSSIASGSEGADILIAPSTGNVLLSGFDLVTGLGLKAGSIDVLDGGSGQAAVTYGLSSPVQPFAEDGDNGYILVRNFRASTADLVISDSISLSTAVRTVPGPNGSPVTGIGLHVDNNRNGSFDSGDNLFALLEGVSTLPDRLVKI